MMCELLMGVAQSSLSMEEQGALHKIGVWCDEVGSTLGPKVSAESGASWSCAGFRTITATYVTSANHAPLTFESPDDVAASREHTREESSQFTAWMESVLLPSLVVDGGPLNLSQIGHSYQAQGVLVVRRRGPGVTVINQIPTGCNVSCDSPTPIQVGPAGVPLQFRITKLHPRPRDVSLAIILNCDEGLKLCVPFVVNEPFPALEVVPPCVDFPDTGSLPVALNIHAAEELLLSCKIVKVPPCVDIVAAEGFEHDIHCSIIENAIASRPHQCGSINGYVTFASGNTQIITVKVYHRRPIEIDESIQLYGIFVPGEEVDVCADKSGRLTLLFPDRVRCARDVLGAGGLSYLSSTRAPRDNGLLEWSQDLGGGRKVLVVGRATENMNANANRWSSVCE